MLVQLKFSIVNVVMKFLKDKSFFEGYWKKSKGSSNPHNNTNSIMLKCLCMAVGSRVRTGVNQCAQGEDDNIPVIPPEQATTPGRVNRNNISTLKWPYCIGIFSLWSYRLTSIFWRCCSSLVPFKVCLCLILYHYTIHNDYTWHLVFRYWITVNQENLTSLKFGEFSLPTFWQNKV